MKEYLVPVCILFWADMDVVTASGLVDGNTLDLDDSNDSDYGKIFWNKDQKN